MLIYFVFFDLLGVHIVVVCCLRLCRAVHIAAPGEAAFSAHLRAMQYAASAEAIAGALRWIGLPRAAAPVYNVKI